MFECPQILMANVPDLVARVIAYLDPRGRNSLMELRALVSSPRLSDHFIRGLCAEDLCVVGDSFLSEFTAIGDWRNKTYGVSIEAWDCLRREVEIVENFPFGDLTIKRIQVWPFDPKDLDLESMKIAVAVSYCDLELIREPRIFGAINELLLDYRIEADPKP